MTIRASRTFAALLVSLALLIGACTTPSQTAPGASAQPAGAASAVPTGPLRIALSALGNQTLDPYLSTVGNKVYLSLMFDWLVDIDRQSNPDYKRSIAESSEISADKKVHTYKIRKGVKFHDDSDLTSADVKFSLERITGPDARAPYAGDLRKSLVKIEAPDPYTVIVTTKEPSIFLDYQLSPLLGNEGIIVPKAYIEKNGDASFQSRPIGSGPFKFVDFRSDDHLTLTAFDGHWRLKTTYKDIEFRIVPLESTRAALLQRNEVDIIDASARTASELVKAGFGKATKLAGDKLFVYFNVQWLPPFDDKRVREAMNIAIDRDAINNSLFDGTAAVTGGAPVPTTDLGYKSQPLYPYDPERAKALLKEAGVPNPKITAYSFERAGLSNGPLIMQALAGMWQAIGAQVEIKATAFDTVRATKEKGELPGGAVYYINPGGQIIATSRLQSMFSSGSNLTPVTRDPRIDRLVADLAASKDLASYKAGVAEIQDYVRANHLLIPLVDYGPVYLTQKSIAAWDFTKAAGSMDLLNLVEKR